MDYISNLATKIWQNMYFYYCIRHYEKKLMNGLQKTRFFVQTIVGEANHNIKKLRGVCMAYPIVNISFAL